MIGIYEYMKKLGLTRVPGRLQYLQQTRSRPCLLCGSSRAVEAHHEGPHGLGKKTPDWLAVPLCSECHAARHSGRVPDTFAEVVYLAQVQFLWWEIERQTEGLKKPEIHMAGCGGCGSVEMGENRFTRLGVPVCLACAGFFKVKGADFATPFGLVSMRKPPSDLAYFRQLHVLVLAASAEKGRKK